MKFYAIIRCQFFIVYLTPTSSSSKIVLLFSFGSAKINRSWNIKVGLLACDADYLGIKELN